MHLMNKLFSELLTEDTWAQRKKSFSSEQLQEVGQIKQDLNDYFNELGISQKSKTRGEDFRLDVKDFLVTPESIDLALKNLGYDIHTTVIEKGEDGAKSGKFPTVKITTNLGGIIYIVLAGHGKQTSDKQFSPSKFNIDEEAFEYEKLYEHLKTQIEKDSLSDNIKEYLLYLLETVTFNKMTRISNIITIDKDYDESSIKDYDKKNIEKDFGEVLSAIAIARQEKDLIIFPKESNARLIDFEVGNIRYSVKSKTGAPATLSTISKDQHDFVKNDLDIPEDERKILLKMFDSINGKYGVEQTFLMMAKILDKSIWAALLNLLEVKKLEIDKSKKALYIIKDKLDYYYQNGKLEDKLTEFYDLIGTSPVTHISKYSPRENWRHGFVIGPIAYQIPKILNANKYNVLTHMKEIINNVENAKQVNFYNRENILEFKIKDFDKNVNIKFFGGGSVNQPNKQNLRFKILD